MRSTTCPAHGTESEGVADARLFRRKARKTLSHSDGELVYGNVTGAGSKIVTQLMDKDENTHEQQGDQ